ncbi:MAG: hypothetical protein MUF21_12420 [Gemmatimonadaceae bacterium]|jgi:uncharacterized protein (DUF697 family)/tellurite resistance protein|nr:hypothetical protein [Gemmatimonadaceae bacterium]
MSATSATALITIAALAADADGTRDPAERAEVAAAASRLGVPGVEAILKGADEGGIVLGDIAAQLPDEATKRLAYDVAVAVCNADGPANARETAFLATLATTLGLDDGAAVATVAQSTAASLASAPVASTVEAAPAASPAAPVVDRAALDQFILDQSIYAGAIELLPDKLANLAILPLQTRMVFEIGKRHGQELDASQVKDLITTVGVGAAAQMLERVLRGVLGNVAGGLLGGLFGGAASVAAGGTVTFAATYALGHAAAQYYAQGRSLSGADLKALFTRFQGEAASLFPQVQARIGQLAAGGTVQSILGNMMRPGMPPR